MIETQRIFFERQAEAFVKHLGNRAYGDHVPFSAEYSHSVLPVSFQKRTAGTHLPISEGDVWGKAWESAWFRLNATVPEKWGGKTVVALLDFGGEGCIFAEDGTPLQGLSDTSFHDPSFHRDRYLLFDPCSGGENVELWVETAANFLFGIKRSEDPKRDDPDRFGTYEARIDKMRLAVFRTDDWHLWLDAGSLLSLMKSLPDGSVRRARILHALTGAANAFKGGNVHSGKAREILAARLAQRASSSDLATVAVGHAHIDTGWLWPIRETVRKCARTFSSQAALIERYPQYVFGASQAQHYAFTKHHYPTLYKKICSLVASKRWEVQGAMWVEADCNVPSGESLLRQMIHGKRFFKDEFGVEVRNLWIPDVFGYPASLPGIMKSAGVDYFLTQKISWSQFNRFPHHTFRWKGIDGSEVITHFPPEDTYNSTLQPKALNKARGNFEEKGYLDEYMTLFGVGDGGGGPKEEHIEYGLRQHDTEGSPRVVFGRADDFFERLARRKAELPIWDGELYLEYHRGTLTTQARNKKANRRIEYALREIEALFSCLPLEEYPVADLDAAWKVLLLHQFHDILPGSSIHEVYDDSTRAYQELASSLANLKERAYQKLLRTDDDTIALVNTLSYSYDDPVVLPESWAGCSVRLTDSAGTRDEILPIQQEEGRPVVLPEVAAFSAVTLSKVTDESVASASAGHASTDLVLENDRVRYEFRPNGTLASAYDKEYRREVLDSTATGNLLSLYHDRPLGNDAWDIDIYYEQHLLQQVEAVSWKRIAEGPVRQGLRFEFSFGGSTMKQCTYLGERSKRLDFVTHMDWNERRRMLRVSFPVDVRATEASYDIQFGLTRRPTHRNTSWDMAKFESAGHRFADLSDESYGAALLNDCKYGYKVFGNTLDLNLLRSPVSPDPEADIGAHSFTYSFLPHAGRLADSEVFCEAAKLNQGILLFEHADAARFQPPCTLIGDSVVLDTLKKAETDQALVIRAYETCGQRSHAVLRVPSGTDVSEADAMEENRSELTNDNGEVQLVFGPFQIRTFVLRPN